LDILVLIFQVDGRSVLISTETDLISELRDNAFVHMHPLPSPPRALQTSNRVLFTVVGPLKVLLQIWSLWSTLAYKTRPTKWLLLQNPPSIPTLLIASVVCFLRGTKLIIDWHNFGYSILALKLGDGHPLVRIAFSYEFLLGRFAHQHLTVTDAMQTVLQQRLGPSAAINTLHDRPAQIFQPATEAQNLAFFQQYPTLVEHYQAIADGRAKLLVSSTSWTPDEDFGLLLDALCDYSAAATDASGNLPDLVMVITGKGPQKEHYLSTVAKMQAKGRLNHVSIYTDWLSFEDYAQLLAAADLGVSLHTSSSGVDLPMKVVDMFGAGLPVLGWSKFAAWPELVKEDINGKGFGSAKEMSEILTGLFRPGNRALFTWKVGAMLESRRRWSDEWDPVMTKVLQIRQRAK
jgi:beta-1,4-mannosyltransferase